MASEASPTRPPLSPPERRVLGVLVEKAKTTPDVYPLSLNAMLAGCNQKSNREPVVEMTEPEVEEALASLQQKGLAIKVVGGRVVRWRHNLYDAWKVGKPELAILGELLLRGPQTEGELRSRACRMEPIAELEDLRGFLRPLAERGLVVYLSPEGRRGTVVTHGFHAAGELVHWHDSAEAGPGAEAAARAPASVSRAAELQGLREEAADLRGRVADLEGQLRALRQAVEGRPAAAPASTEAP